MALELFRRGVFVADDELDLGAGGDADFVRDEAVAADRDLHLGVGGGDGAGGGKGANGEEKGQEGSQVHGGIRLVSANDNDSH